MWVCVCVCGCVCAGVRMRMRVCVRVYVGGWMEELMYVVQNSSGESGFPFGIILF